MQLLAWGVSKLIGGFSFDKLKSWKTWATLGVVVYALLVSLLLNGARDQLIHQEAELAGVKNTVVVMQRQQHDTAIRLQKAEKEKNVSHEMLEKLRNDVRDSCRVSDAHAKRLRDAANRLNSRHR